MHKNPYKHRFIAGSSKCSTKPLSILLSKLLTHIKQGRQKYCETSFSKIGVNQMWILKNSKELLEHIQYPNFNHITSIKSFDFSTSHKNGNCRYKFLLLCREGPYFVQEHSDSKNKYTEDDIIDFRGKVFPTDSRHSNGHRLCPSPSRHISVLIQSGIHTVFALNW